MLSIIIVNYNSWDLLKMCLGTIHLGAGRVPYEVIVVDNASDRDESAEILALFPWVIVVKEPENRGFAAANNQGIIRSRGNYILLLNPDTEVEPGALAELVTFLEAFPRVGIAGPKIYYPEGSLQYSCGRFPTLLTELLENFPLARFLPGQTGAGYYLYRTWDHATSRAVDWVTGACLLIRRQTIDQIGLMDEHYFMYSEELDWCYRAREAGWLTYYHPRAVIIHHEGGSSRTIDRHERLQRLVYRHYISSTRRFFRKFYGRSAEFVLRIMLLFSHELRLLKLRRMRETETETTMSQAKQAVIMRVIADLQQPLRESLPPRH